MWLIDTHTLDLKEFHDERGISYAILSHRWEEEEVLFRHMSPGYDRNIVRRMKGFNKIERCCDKARMDGIQYAWVDTCCIDKSSSAELQEAINSMFRWYSSARICYAYLSDVKYPDDGDQHFRASLWFQRGWTLQELLAPKNLIFFNCRWYLIGTRRDLCGVVHEVTHIKQPILVERFTDQKLYEGKVLVAEIMSWAKGRKTTRIEDRAYSLMGLFGVSMTMLYGEGVNAFRRLQEEIVKHISDQSIFMNNKWNNLNYLARSPDDFPPWRQDLRPKGFSIILHQFPSTITSEGIGLTVDLVCWKPFSYLALLNIQVYSDSESDTYRIGIFVRRVGSSERYVRQNGLDDTLWIGSERGLYHERTPIVLIIDRLDEQESYISRYNEDQPYGFRIRMDQHLIDSIYFVHYTVASEHAIWNNDRDMLELQPGAGGFVGAVILGVADPSHYFVTVMTLGYFGNFVPHCGLLRMRQTEWAVVSMNTPRIWIMNEEAQNGQRWSKIGDHLVSDRKSSINIEEVDRTSSVECKRLRDGTLLLRQTAINWRSSSSFVDASVSQFDFSCSIPDSDGSCYVYRIKMPSDIFEWQNGYKITISDGTKSDTNV